MIIKIVVEHAAATQRTATSNRKLEADDGEDMAIAFRATASRSTRLKHGAQKCRYMSRGTSSRLAHFVGSATITHQIFHRAKHQ
jgi:hypothetical protein